MRTRVWPRGPTVDGGPVRTESAVERESSTPGRNDLKEAAEAVEGAEEAPGEEDLRERDLTQMKRNSEKEVSYFAHLISECNIGYSSEGVKVFVSNLAFESTWRTLKDHMRQAGDVLRADIFEDERGRSRGIG
jgi:RNA recognition motif-containing protein